MICKKHIVILSAVDPQTYGFLFEGVKMRIEIIKEYNLEKFKNTIQNILDNVQRNEKVIDIKYTPETKYLGSEIITIYHAMIILK